MGQVNRWLVEQGESPQWDWNRLPQQREFLTSSAPFHMYSGGFGTGKTYALCAKIVSLMTLVPGNLGYLARQDGKALKQTTMLVLMEMIPKSWVHSHDSQKGVLRLKPEVGGSMLVYGDLKDKGDLKNHNLGFFAVDQAEEMEWNSWELLAGRLRRKTPILDPTTKLRQYWVAGKCQKTEDRHFTIGSSTKTCALCSAVLPPFDEREGDDQRPVWDLIIYPRFGFGVCNTEDPSHWIYTNFSGLPGQDQLFSKGIEGYQAYHATTYDGLKAGFVDREYVANLERTYHGNQLMYDRYLLGKWVIAEGLVFPSFRRDIHVYQPDELTLEDWLPVHEYIDPGITATNAVGWVVVQHCQCGCGKPNFYLIDEHYVASAIPEYHCSQIKEHRRAINRHVISTEMDEQAFSRSNIQKITEQNESRLYSLAQLYIDQEIFVRRNQKDWDAGHARLSSAMAPDPKHHHPVTGEPGAPHFFVSANCKWFIWEMVNYKWKKRKADGNQTEEPSDRDDHHMDGIISFMAARPEHKIIAPDRPDTRPVFQREMEEELDELTGVGVVDFMTL